MPVIVNLLGYGINLCEKLVEIKIFKKVIRREGSKNGLQLAVWSNHEKFPKRPISRKKLIKKMNSTIFKFLQ